MFVGVVVVLLGGGAEEFLNFVKEMIAPFWFCSWASMVFVMV